MFPPSTTPAPAVAPDPAAARIARAQAKLEELAEMGMDVARSVHNRVLKDDVREAMNERRPGDALDLSILAQAFERAARSVRITLALQTRLDHPPRLAQPRVALAEAPDRLDRVEGPSLPRDREPTVERDHDQALTLIDRCLTEAAPLPEPVGPIVRRICQDLDTPYDPDLWTDAEPPKSPARPNHPRFKPRTTRTASRDTPHPLPPDPAHPGESRDPGRPRHHQKPIGSSPDRGPARGHLTGQPGSRPPPG